MDDRKKSIITPIVIPFINHRLSKSLGFRYMFAFSHRPNIGWCWFKSEDRHPSNCLSHLSSPLKPTETFFSSSTNLLHSPTQLSDSFIPPCKTRLILSARSTYERKRKGRNTCAKCDIRSLDGGRLCFHAGRVVEDFACLLSLEEEDGVVAEVEVYEVLGLVSDEGAEISADDTVPGWASSVIELWCAVH